MTNQPGTGRTAPVAGPLSFTTETPRVMVGGSAAEVTYSGLAPGSVGVYQVDVRVPMDAPSGVAVPISVTIGGATSNVVTIAVE